MILERTDLGGSKMLTLETVAFKVRNEGRDGHRVSMLMRWFDGECGKVLRWER